MLCQHAHPVRVAAAVVTDQQVQPPGSELHSDLWGGQHHVVLALCLTEHLSEVHAVAALHSWDLQDAV